jgi:ubiquinone/menaquinone biosynthesis C-methylase UbiE
MPGHVDLLNNFLVSGWATTGDGKSDVIEVVVNGVSEATVLASYFRDDLQKLGIGEGKCAFRYTFDRPVGLFREAEVLVRSKSTGHDLPGKRQVAPLMFGEAGYHAYYGDRFVVTALRHIERTVSNVLLKARVIAPRGSAFTISCSDVRAICTNLTVTGQPDVARDLNVLAETRSVCQDVSIAISLTADISDVPFIEVKLSIEPSSSPDQAPLYVLGSMFVPVRPLWTALPTEQHWRRVAGPGVSAEMFVAGGFGGAFKIHQLASRWLPAVSAPTVLDWGVGCGRVAVPLKRSFWPEANIIGVDVDEFNVSWCRDNLPDIKVSQIDFYPPIDVESGSIDLLYGISVMTHLTQVAQEVWLRELKRILKPGGICILTVHGDYHVILGPPLPADVYRNIKLYGIADSMQDTTLGSLLPEKGYYRGTIQLRQQIVEAWGKNFDVIQYLPAANSIHQDIVVLRKT